MRQRRGERELPRALGAGGFGLILRRIVIAAASLSALAILLGAIYLGWQSHEWFSPRRATYVTVTVNRPIKVVKAQRNHAGLMPNVLGLQVDTARQVLADAGVDPAAVTTTDQPYAGETGLVIDQEPASGATVSAPVKLVLSAPATMPKLVGQTVVAARDTLARIGTSAFVKTRYDAGASEGSVLETDPAEGESLSDRATLIVSEAPSSVFLTQLRSITSSCGTETLNVAGAQQKDALVCSPSQGSPSVMEYLLNGHVASFQATIGLGDRGESTVPVTFRVVVDGQPIAIRTVGFGRSRTISVPVRGALRIHLEAAVGVAASSASTSVQAAWGDARLLGGRSAIDNLIAESSQ